MTNTEPDTPYLDPGDTDWVRRRRDWAVGELHRLTRISYAANLTVMVAAVVATLLLPDGWPLAALGAFVLAVAAIVVWHKRTVNCDRLFARWHAENGRPVDETHPWWSA